MPKIHLIGCRGVKLVLTKDFGQKWFFGFELQFCNIMSCFVIFLVLPTFDFFFKVLSHFNLDFLVLSHS